MNKNHRYFLLVLLATLTTQAHLDSDDQRRAAVSGVLWVERDPKVTAKVHELFCDKTNGFKAQKNELIEKLRAIGYHTQQDNEPLLTKDQKNQNRELMSSAQALTIVEEALNHMMIDLGQVTKEMREAINVDLHNEMLLAISLIS